MHKKSQNTRGLQNKIILSLWTLHSGVRFLSISLFPDASSCHMYFFPGNTWLENYTPNFSEDEYFKAILSEIRIQILKLASV